jgi:hypothetical protein
VTRPWKPGTGQWALELDGVEPPKPKRRPRMYIYTEATHDGAFVIRTPDFDERNDLLTALGTRGYWSGLYRGIIVRAQYLRDFVAACQERGWYVRIKPYEAAPC